MLATVFAIIAAAEIKYKDSDDMTLCKLVGDKTCTYYKAINAAFSFSIITAVFCFMCVVAAGASIVKEELYDILSLVVSVLNLLGFLMQLVSVIMIPFVFDQVYQKNFYDEETDEMKKFWACAFVSMLFNFSAAAKCLKM